MLNSTQQKSRSSFSLSGVFFLCLIVCMALIVTSCATREGELAHVAKDWCLTIRAGQVIPVYPLSEDIQPGDIYVVTKPIPEQVELWESQGFLPFDRLVARMKPNGYANFYDNSYGTQGKTNLPHNWQFPTTGYTNSFGVVTNTDWANAPRAAFPTYSFKIEKGGGINMALPIQGVPVAITALGASSATANVVLKNAYTYGVDEESISRQVQAWAEANVNYLQLFQPSAKPRPDGTQYSFLRVVTRVYLVSQVNVTVTSDDAFSAQASGGAPKPIDNLTMMQSTTNNLAASSNFDSAQGALTNSAGQLIPAPTAATTNLAQLASTVIPGGTIRIAAASSRAISMDENFDRPLVVGYLALEYPIVSGGQILHGAYSTLDIVSGKRTPEIPVFVGNQTRPFASDAVLLRQYNKSNPGGLKQWLQDHHHADVEVADLLDAPGGHYDLLRQQVVIELGLK